MDNDSGLHAPAAPKTPIKETLHVLAGLSQKYNDDDGITHQTATIRCSVVGIPVYKSTSLKKKMNGGRAIRTTPSRLTTGNKKSWLA